MEDKIFNSGFNNVEYGSERATQQEISISSAVSDRYEENTSESIEDVYTRRKMMEKMEQFYEESEFYEKYGQEPKRVDRCDFFKIYYYFKDKLKELYEYDAVQIFCAIAEFFDLNYKVIYKDIITLEDKVEILDILEDQYGLDKPLQNSKKLF